VGSTSERKEEALVGRPLGHLDGPELRLGDAKQLGLPTGHLAVELGVAEQRGAHALVAILGGLALRVELVIAHPAGAAGDVEGDDDAVPGLDLCDLGADLLDDPHGLVAEDVALVDERSEHLVEVQVRAADGRRGDAHDRIGRLLDRRVGHGVDPNVPLAVVGQRLHRSPLAPWAAPSRCPPTGTRPGKGAHRARAEEVRPRAS
jgi:hypothetical protein